MKTNIKKIVKLLTLLAISMLIATVSATIYDSLFLSAQVGVEGLTLVWDDTGIDSGLSADIQGAYCTLTGLKAPQGGNRTYSKAIGLNNTGAATTFDIEVVDVTGASTNHLDYIFIVIYDGTTFKGNLTVWENNAKGTQPVENLSIGAGAAWRLEWHIAWQTSAQTTDSVTVSLKVTTPSP